MITRDLEHILSLYYKILIGRSFDHNVFNVDFENRVNNNNNNNNNNVNCVWMCFCKLFKGDYRFKNKIAFLCEKNIGNNLH